MTVAGVRFRNPFYVSSGPTTMTIDQLIRIRNAGWGGASLKLTVYPLPYINRVPRYGYYPKEQLLTFTAEKRLLLDELLRLIEAGKKQTPELVLFANITYAGDEGPEGWVKMAKQCEAAGVDVVELNMCCPNMSFNVELSGKDTGGPKTGASMGRNQSVASQVVSAVKKALSIPLFVKLTPEGGRIAEVAAAALEAGADAVGGTANRLGIPPINLDDPTRSMYHLQKEVGMACLSGDWLRPLALRDVYEMRRRVGPEPVLTGVGGVSEWRDAIEMAMCGADLIGSCAATIIKGFGFMPEFIEGVRNYLREKGYSSLREIRDMLIPAIRSAPELTIFDGHAQMKETRAVAPCTSACPNHVPAQGYVQRVAEENFEDAYQLIMSRSPLQSICGKVCDHPCEAACTRGIKDEPIMIRAIKRFVIEMAEKKGWKPNILDRRAARNGRPVAIIGSGPAGIAAAYDLARAGYAVTVFEAAPKAGGMLRYGIPSFRLSDADIDKEIDVLKSLGVSFRHGKRLGADFTLADLRRQGYEAVFLGIGAVRSLRPDIPGVNRPGVWNAIDLLRIVREGKPPKVGRKVAVIGGGFTAIDAARTARRLGATDVYVVYRRTQEEMPAAREEVIEAEEEGIRFMYQIAPTAVEAGDNGTALALNLRHYVMDTARDASGRKRPVEVPGTEFALDVDSVLFAIGQRTECDDPLQSESGGMIQADPQTGQTSTDWVFAGGDCTTGPKDVISAIAAGKRAAVAIDRFLSGDRAFLKADPHCVEVDKDSVLVRYGSQPRAWRPETDTPPAATRVRNFDEYEQVLSVAQAVNEASRCMGCGCGAGCEKCVESCKVAAYSVDESGRIVLDESICVACGVCVQRCPNAMIGMVQTSDKPL